MITTVDLAAIRREIPALDSCVYLNAGGIGPSPRAVTDTIVRLYEQAHDRRDDAARRRREIDNRLERIRELYKWGDLTREAYLAERGIPSDRYLTAMDTVLHLDPEFKIDLIDIETSLPAIRAEIEKEGKAL